MIFVTGDTHIPIDITKLNRYNFPEQKELTKDDFLIICGDFGGVWNGDKEELYWRKWLEEKNSLIVSVPALNLWMQAAGRRGWHC